MNFLACDHESQSNDWLDLFYDQLLYHRDLYALEIFLRYAQNFQKGAVDSFLFTDVIEEIISLVKSM